MSHLSADPSDAWNLRTSSIRHSLHNFCRYEIILQRQSVILVIESVVGFSDSTMAEVIWPRGAHRG
jgi:hypothetical protein